MTNSVIYTTLSIGTLKSMLTSNHFLSTFFHGCTFKISISSFLTTNSSLSRYIPSPPLSDSSSSVSPSMATLINCTASWPDGVSLDSSLVENAVRSKKGFVVCVGVATCDKQALVIVCGMVGTWSGFIMEPGIWLSEEELQIYEHAEEKYSHLDSSRVQ